MAPIQRIPREPQYHHKRDTSRCWLRTKSSSCSTKDKARSTLATLRIHFECTYSAQLRPAWRPAAACASAARHHWQPHWADRAPQPPPRRPRAARRSAPGTAGVGGAPWRRGRCRRRRRSAAGGAGGCGSGADVLCTALRCARRALACAALGRRRRPPWALAWQLIAVSSLYWESYLIFRQAGKKQSLGRREWVKRWSCRTCNNMFYTGGPMALWLYGWMDVAVQGNKLFVAVYRSATAYTRRRASPLVVLISGGALTPF